MHTTQAQYLAAKAAFAVERKALPDTPDFSDEVWEAFELAEKNLSTARHNLCEWGVEFAQGLPFCSAENKRAIADMWAKAQENPTIQFKLAAIVIQLDYKG